MLTSACFALSYHACENSAGLFECFRFADAFCYMILLFVYSGDKDKEGFGP